MLSNCGKLYLLFDELKRMDIDILSDVNFKVIQKTIYIISKMGLKFNYTFRWYSHGPYSSALTQDLHKLLRNKSHYANESKCYFFKQNAKYVIAGFKELFGNKINDEEWLEVVASLLFLKENYQLSEKELKEKLKQKRGEFIDKQKLLDDAVSIVNKITTFQQDFTNVTNREIAQVMSSTLLEVVERAELVDDNQIVYKWNDYKNLIGRVCREGRIARKETFSNVSMAGVKYILEWKGLVWEFRLGIEKEKEDLVLFGGRKIDIFPEVLVYEAHKPQTAIQIKIIT